MMSTWSQYPQSTLEFCESLMNGWVRQPANMWSNIGFLIVGIILWKRTPATKPYLRIFSIGSFLVGLTSAFFHLSMTFVGQFLDVSSMFLTVGILAVLNAVRLLWLKPAVVYRSLFFMQFLAMVFMAFFQGNIGEMIFAFQVIFVFVSETLLIRRSRLLNKKVHFQNYSWWGAAAIGYLCATAVWYLDLKKIWCDSENHWFNGHAVWHLLNAIVVYCLYRFYEEIFDDKFFEK